MSRKLFWGFLNFFLCTLAISCGGNNSPSSPAATATPVPPTPTNTVCMVGGTPCTSTFTPSNTSTSTATNSATPTATFTFTNSPTVSSTPTLTATASSTGTPTDSQTPTATGTSTGTPTSTWTPNGTICHALLATLTPGPNILTGTMTYTGSVATPSASHPIGVFCLALSPLYSTWASVTVNGGTYSLNANSAGATLFYWTYFNALGPQFAGDFGYHVGDPYTYYNSDCSTSAGTSIIVSGVTSLNLTLSDTCRIEGFHGIVNYTGSLGTAQNCTPICIVASTASDFSTTSFAVEGVYQNNVRYDLATLPNIGHGNGDALYLRAFLSRDGSPSACASFIYACPDPGDPYIDLGLQTVGTSAIDITFGDTNIWP